jgi:uncharacterized membrane protein YqgA involved in biofilm formation
MPISGTILNVFTVLLGGTLGLLVGGRMPPRFHGIIMGAIGLSTLVIGMQSALQTTNPLILIGAALIGGLLGELLRLSDALDRLGDYLKRRFAGSGKGSSTFTEAFVTSSIVFCVGPLTILGAIQNGSSGDTTFLAIKSLLDGFTAFAFTAALGWGVLMSAITVFVYQSAISLLAAFFLSSVPNCPDPSHCNNPYIVEMTAVGGLIILGVGLKLLDLKDLKLANYLPALAVAPLIVWVLSVWPFK